MGRGFMWSWVFFLHLLVPLPFGWASYLESFSLRRSKNEHQQLQAYIHLATAVERGCLFRPLSQKKSGLTYWFSFGHMLLPEPITVARAVASADWLGSVIGPALDSGGSLLVSSTESREGWFPKVQLVCSYQKKGEGMVGRRK